MTLSCSNCGFSDFITTQRITKEADEVYKATQQFKCYYCGEKLPMSRNPVAYMGLIQLGKDVE